MAAAAIVRLQYVNIYKDRYGKRRAYLRRPGWPAVALAGIPGTAEFIRSYNAAIAMTDGPAPTEAIRSQPGTLHALAEVWYQSSGYKLLRASTQITYRRIVERLRREHGDKMIAALQPHHIRRLMERRADTPNAANHLLRVLRLLLRYAVDINLLAADPTAGVRRLRIVTDGIPTWTEADIAQYELHWPTGSMARLAFALLLYTGQRRSDVIRMAPRDVTGGALTVRQGKTGARLLIPVHPALAREIAGIDVRRPAYLLTAHSKPFASSTAFYNRFRDWCQAAGNREGLSPHGLRKAAARRLAEAGCTAHQIAAITGHRTLAEVQRYTIAANQEHLATEAMRRITNEKD